MLQPDLSKEIQEQIDITTALVKANNELLQLVNESNNMFLHLKKEQLPRPMKIGVLIFKKSETIIDCYSIWVESLDNVQIFFPGFTSESQGKFLLEDKVSFVQDGLEIYLELIK